MRPTRARRGGPRCAPSPGSWTRAVARVGLSNVNRLQLDEALGLAPIAAVEIALGPFEDRALRGGVVDRCAETGIAVIAHSPLGGPRRARSLDRRPELVELAAAHDARRRRWRSRGSSVSGRTSSRSRGRGGPRRRARPREPRRSSSPPRSASASRRQRGRRDPAARGDREVVLVMGIPGAGKSRLAEDYAARGHLRLNRDERGGTLRRSLPSWTPPSGPAPAA